MKDEDYEEHYYDVQDTYVATVKNLKRKNCCVQWILRESNQERQRLLSTSKKNMILSSTLM